MKHFNDIEKLFWKTIFTLKQVARHILFTFNIFLDIHLAISQISLQPKLAIRLVEKSDPPIDQSNVAKLQISGIKGGDVQRIPQYDQCEGQKCFKLIF